MLIRASTLVLMFTILIINTLFLVGLTKFLSQVVVYDIDYIRQQYTEDVKYQYMQGCLRGTQWPEEYQDIIGFNPNNATYWCSDGKQEMENDLYIHLRSLRKQCD